MLGFVRLPNRGFLRLSGPDRLGFLQGLVSNDVNAVRPGHAVYACLLTPQGKFLHDFFLIADGESLLIECEADRRGDLAQRLKTYRLRSKIEIAEADYAAYAILPTPSVIPAKAGIHGDVSAGGGMDSRFRGNDDIGMNDVFGKDSHGAVPEAAGAIVFPDPRMPALAARMAIPAGNADAAIGDTGLTALTFDDYEQARIAEAAPDGSRDMEVGKAILLENNIDLLNGIAWDKGCYTGQELTARTRYRGLIKKRLIPIRISGSVPPIGTPLLENGGEIGEMRSASGDLGLALIRLERLRQGGSIHVGDAILTPQVPDALASAIAQVQP